MNYLYLNRLWVFRAKAIFGMVVGTILIVGIMLFLNNLKTEPAGKNERSALSFQVVKKIKTPKQPKPKPKPKPIPKQTNIPPPSLNMADLGIGISGIDFGTGGYVGSEIEGVDNKLLGDTSNTVMTGNTVDQQPRALSRPALKYPARALAKEIEGFVMLSILIDETGGVSEIKVIESDPPDTFDEAAIRNIKKWQFSPARYQGKPVSIWVNQPISFTLG